MLPEASAQRSRVAFSLAAPSSASGGNEPGAFNPHGAAPAGPHTAEEEEEEEEEEEAEEEEEEGEGGEEEGGVVGQDPPCDVAGGPRVTARALSYSEIQVSWTIPSVPGCDDEVSVTVTGGKSLNVSTTDTSVTETGLDPETRYCYTVTADDRGSGSACARTPERDPECNLTGASMDSAVANGTSAVLAWSPAHNGHCDALLYTVYRNDVAIPDLKGTDKTSATVPNLSPGTHRFKVKAYEGNQEATSPSKRVTISCQKPAKPSGLRPSRSGTDVTVTWGTVSVSGCAVTYKVWRDNSVVATVGGKSHTESRPAGTYSYRVSAVATSADGTTSAESDRSDPESVTVPACGNPDVPSGLTADRQGTTSTIDVSWNRVSVPDGCSSVTYVLTRGGTEIKRTTGTSHSDGDLDPGTYHYRVSAESNPGSNNSGESGPASGTIPRPRPPTPAQPPATPTGIQASASRTSITISWKASTGATGYGIRMEGDDTTRKSVAGTSYAWPSLSSGTEYCFEVRASNAAGTSSWSSPATCATTTPDPPPTPTGLGSAAQSTTAIRITWDSAERATGYDVKKVSPGSEETESATGTEHTWSGLVAATRYCFEVRATNAGGASAWTDESCATTDAKAVETPANLSATASSASAISVSWDAVTGADSYELQRKAGAGEYGEAFSGGSGTSHGDTGLTASTEYCYQVRTVDGDRRSAWSAEDCATTQALPPVVVPGNLTVSAASASAISVSWDAVTGADSYEVLRRLGTGNYPADSEAVSVSGTKREDSGLTARTEYCYQVRTVEGSRRSAWSAEGCATTLAPPPTVGAPSNLTVKAESSSVVALSWTAGRGATRYEVLRVAGRGAARGESGAFFVDGATSARDTGRTPEVRYCYRVRSEGNPSWTPERCATTLAAAPDAPADFRAVAASASSVELSWKAVDGADSYEVRSKAPSPAMWGEWEDVGTEVTRTVSDLAADTEYAFEVRTVRSGVKSVSVSASAQTDPVPPGDFAASSLSATSVRLSWTAVSGADSYEVRRKTGDGEYGEAFSGGTGTSHDDTGLKTGKKYCYQARTVSGERRSAWTQEEACATPREPPLAVPGNVAARARSPVTVRLTWDEVSGADGYRFRWKKGQGRWSRAEDAGTGTHHDHKKLIPGTGYRYQVRSVVKGRKSEWSGTVKATTKKLAVPKGLATEALSSGGVRLTWKAVTGAAGYEIERRKVSRGARPVLLAATDVSYDDGEVEAETTYEYRVQSVVERDGTKRTSEWSASVSVTTRRAQVGVPAGLTARATSPVGVELEWRGVTEADRYRVRSKKGQGRWKPVADEVTGTTYSHTRLEPDTTYRYQVRAVSGRRESPWSEAVKTTTPALGVPGGLEAEALSSTAVDLSWDAVAGADGYQLERVAKTAGGSPALIPVSGTTHTDGALQAETTYEYRVQSVVRRPGATLMSGWSGKVSVTTPRAMLGVPANLTATARTAFSVGLRWDPVAGAVGYQLRRWVAGAQSYTVTPVSGTSHEDSELAPNTEYTYRVLAVRGAEVSGESDEASATTSAFAAPGSFQAAAPDATSMRVSWTAVPETGAQYRLQHRKKGKKKWKTATVDGTGKVIGGLAPDTRYQFRVTAERTSGGTLYRSEAATAEARTPTS